MSHLRSPTALYCLQPWLQPRIDGGHRRSYRRYRRLFHLDGS